MVSVIPVDALGCNCTYHLPGSPGEGNLPCVVDHEARTVRSYWRPSDDDKMMDGQAIYFHVNSSTKPIKIGLITSTGEGEMEEVPLVSWEGGGVASVVFDAEVIGHIMDGGYVALEVSQVPPFPVSVWIDHIPD